MLTNYPQSNSIINNYSQHLTKKEVSKNTIRNYVSDVKIFIKWFSDLRGISFNSPEDLNKINAELVVEYRNFLISRSGSSKTVNRKLTSLRQFIQYLSDKKFIAFTLNQELNNIHLSAGDEKSPLLTQYRKYLADTGFTQNTQKNYLSDIRHFFSFNNLSIDSAESSNTLVTITPECMQAYSYEITLTHSPATAKRKLIAIRSFFNWAKTRSLISQNPALTHSNPRVSLRDNSRLGKSAFLLVGLVLSILIGSKYRLQSPYPVTISEASDTTLPKQTKSLGGLNQEAIYINSIDTNSLGVGDKTYMIKAVNKVTVPLEAAPRVENINSSADYYLLNSDNGEEVLGNDNQTPVLVSLETSQGTESAGTATLPANSQEITIENAQASPNSLIFITPSSPTNNQQLYIKQKNEGSFVVGIENPQEQDIDFNWWIVKE